MRSGESSQAPRLPIWKVTKKESTPVGMATARVSGSNSRWRSSSCQNRNVGRMPRRCGALSRDAGEIRARSRDMFTRHLPEAGKIPAHLKRKERLAGCSADFEAHGRTLGIDDAKLRMARLATGIQPRPALGATGQPTLAGGVTLARLEHVVLRGGDRLGALKPCLAGAVRRLQRLVDVGQDKHGKKCGVNHWAPFWRKCAKRHRFCKRALEQNMAGSHARRSD